MPAPSDLHTGTKPFCLFSMDSPRDFRSRESQENRYTLPCFYDRLDARNSIQFLTSDCNHPDDLVESFSCLGKSPDWTMQ